MKHRIFERFTDTNKWKDYVNPKSFECKIALFITLIFFAFSYRIELYEDFSLYLTPLRNITIYIAQALIGVIGIIIAGVAIIFSVLNKQIVDMIKKVSNKDVQNLVVSFEFLAFNVGIGIFIFFLVHLTLYSNLALFNEIVFHFLIVFFTYFIFFIIFYSISLISNIIRLFNISNIYDDLNTYDKSIHDIANEIRIDYILQTLLTATSVDKKEFLRSLDEYLDGSTVKEKEEIKKYFRNYYGDS